MGTFHAQLAATSQTATSPNPYHASPCTLYRALVNHSQVIPDAADDISCSVLLRQVCISTYKRATLRPNASATHFNNNNREPSVTIAKTLWHAARSSLLRLIQEIGPNLAIGNDAKDLCLFHLDTRVSVARQTISDGGR